MVALTGTGRLADDMCLLAHHEVSGRPFLQPRAIGLDLAGGLLAELVLFGAIRVAGEALAAADRVRPQDGLMRAVRLDMLRERQRHGARDWLAFLVQSAAENVARRLGVSGPGAVPASAARRADCAFAPLIRVPVASGTEARS